MLFIKCCDGDVGQSGWFLRRIWVNRSNFCSLKSSAWIFSFYNRSNETNEPWLIGESLIYIFPSCLNISRIQFEECYNIHRNQEVLPSSSHAEWNYTLVKKRQDLWKCWHTIEHIRWTNKKNLARFLTPLPTPPPFLPT